MQPVIAIVGRPNVGKSTLFNTLTQTRDAIVADQPGSTRDRNYGIGRLGERRYIVVDTGGLTDDARDIDALTAEQARAAMQESDVIVFVVDGRQGLMPADQEIASELRRLGKRLVLAVNKTDGLNADNARAEFHALGLGDPWAIAASHGHGVRAMIDAVLQEFPAPEEESGDADGIRVAIIGRPNVGKSTLVNRMLGEERVIVYDLPGTTRDSITIPFSRDDQSYLLIDTAGVRRRGSVTEAVEKFSVIKTLDAIERSNVVILVLDAQQEISNQDAHLLGHLLNSGRALVIAVNKWDGLAPDQRERIRSELHRKLSFLDYARIHFISALHGSGVGDLFDSVQEAYRSATRTLPTPKLTEILERALQEHQPPLVKGRRIKLRYAHQGGKNPPRIVIHGNQTESVPDSYKRFLASRFRDVLKIRGTPVVIEFKSSRNPYARRARPTPRR
jgi:GTP-binding protein